MGETPFERDGYYARWHAHVRLLSLAFRPQTHMKGPATTALFQFIEPYVSDGKPWLMLTDAANVINVDADTRRLAREFFSQHRARMSFGVHGANLLVRTMFGFFVMTVGLTGRMFVTREEALTWLGLSGDYPAS